MMKTSAEYNKNVRLLDCSAAFFTKYQCKSTSVRHYFPDSREQFYDYSIKTLCCIAMIFVLKLADLICSCQLRLRPP